MKFPPLVPFQDRLVSLDQAVKVGRSVARARPATSNAIFDCKVLSRNHALIWYDGGKFFLQDTKSSNGTFVNNQRWVFVSGWLQYLGLAKFRNQEKSMLCYLLLVQKQDGNPRSILAR